MPRNASGVMVLPVGNPVIPGTLIDSSWANPTMADLANEITRSLPRDGAAGMTGPLMLARDGLLPKEAVTVDQINAALTGSNSYLPAGAIQYFAMMAIPAGWLEANGAAVSRTTYANLFATIGTTYGAGNGTTTFNLPDLRGTFIRGFDNGRSLDPGRVFGSTQAADNAPHTHAINDPGHAHGVTDPSHTHTLADPGHTHGQAAHTHGVTDPGHAHSVMGSAVHQQYDSGGGPVPLTSEPNATGASATGVSIQPAQPGISAAVTGAYNQPAGTGVGVSAAHSGISQATSGIEARPINTALVACIKAFGAMQTDGLGSMAFQNKDAVQIAAGTGVFSSLQSTKTPTEPNDVARLADIGGSLAEVFSSDPQVLLVDNTAPSAPVLRPQMNVPNGMAKLNSAGQIPPSLLPVSDLNYQGPWDASSGQTPSQAYPATTFQDGDQYQISVAGTLTVYGSSGAAAPTACTIGSSLVYVVGSPTFPSPGWYYNPPMSFSGASASQISNIPSGNVVATDVQAAINELDSGKVPRTSLTGSALLPAGTDAQRDIVPTVGAIRYSSTQLGWEGWNGTNWVSIGGGQMLGNALVKAISYNSQTIAENLTVAAGTNGFSAGPVTVSDGFAVTISDGANWSII